MTKKPNNNSEIIIYQSDDDRPKIEVKLQDETTWLSQQQMADLYQTARTNIVEHIQHIYEEDELDRAATCRNFRQVRTEGNRSVSREIPFYNLDMIISLGYRINSKTATAFRRWATERLREYLIKGFTLDDERLKKLGGSDYFKELLARIRDIRSSEKVLYRQVLDLYATSVDYDPKSPDSAKFFQIVQNKLHYATHKHTAAEIIYTRADANKKFMGLTTFAGDLPVLEEVRVAKNYLTETEISKLNRLVSAYFDLAETRAIERKTTRMSDYVKMLDTLADNFGAGVLPNAGKISHKKAVEKAEKEYRKFQTKTLSSAEKAYLVTLKTLEKKAKKSPPTVSCASQPQVERGPNYLSTKDPGR